MSSIRAPQFLPVLFSPLLIPLLLAPGQATAECRAPTACIACHANVPNSPPPEVLEQLGPASCEVGDFTRGLNMTYPRFIHRSAKLPDGRVVLTGGQIQNNPASVITPTVEAFNPADNSVSPLAPMTIRRWSHTATTLADGRVLVTGGRTASTAPPGVVLATAEVYDPATNTWTETAGPMSVGRRSHQATLLPNGKVLITGGGNGVSTFTSQPLQSAELFDPATGLFTVVGNMNERRSAHAASLLPDGKVLLSGGSNGTGTLFPTNTAEIYDPVANTFTPVGPMNFSHLAQLPATLRDGRVLHAASYFNPSHTTAGGIVTKDSEIYDPATETFTPVAPLIKRRIDIGGQTLLDGTVLIAGGVSTGFPVTIFQSSSEVYDPVTGQWKLSGIMSAGRDEFSGALLDDGRVMISGGFVSPGSILLNTVEVYTPGLEPQINGLFNVIGDLPDSAFQGGHGGRTALSAQLDQVANALPDLGKALQKAQKVSSQIPKKVKDPAAATRLLGINQVLINTLNDRISPNVLPTVAPVAQPSSGVEPVSVAFAGNINDPDGTITSILWKFGDGATSTEANPSHVFQCDGTYRVSLEVVDDRGGVGSGTVTVTVASAGGGPSYACDVQPAFDRSCTGCHGAAARLTLTTCEGLQTGSFRGPVVTPGVKETSTLWQRITSTTNPMPPIGGLLPAVEQNAIGAWIDSLDPGDPNFCD